MKGGLAPAPHKHLPSPPLVSPIDFTEHSKAIAYVIRRTTSITLTSDWALEEFKKRVFYGRPFAHGKLVPPATVFYFSQRRYPLWWG